MSFLLGTEVTWLLINFADHCVSDENQPKPIIMAHVMWSLIKRQCLDVHLRHSIKQMIIFTSIFYLYYGLLYFLRHKQRKRRERPCWVSVEQVTLKKERKVMLGFIDISAASVEQHCWSLFQNFNEDQPPLFVFVICAA